MEHRFDDLPIGASQDLAEHGTGNLNEQSFAFLAAQPRGLEPGGVGVNANSGLDQVKELIPDIEGSGSRPIWVAVVIVVMRELKQSNSTIFPQM